jgi:catechol 2,3-dioxygenase-like lactoylglutathione lyase family enzyme
MPELDHFALAVRDPRASLAFYRDVVGVEGSVREAEYGYVITTPRGVSFTLFQGDPPADVGEFHLGVSLSDGNAVQAARDELRSAGVVELEWSEEPGYISVKVADPDGYIVEISWDDEHETATNRPIPS